MPRHKYIRQFCAVAAAIVHSITPASAQRGAIAPEAGSGRTERPMQSARTFMVSAANPLAVDAGVEILKAGGSAADAAIAVQLVLNLVEPQSSGLGGGSFALHWDAAVQSVSNYDGRETAPASARPDRFLRDGRPLAFDAAVHSGLSIFSKRSTARMAACRGNDCSSPRSNWPKRDFSFRGASICCCV